MKRPMGRGLAIDMHRMTSWVNTFAGYRHPVTEGRIDRWLNQFDQKDRDIAARTLDCVDFITHEHMTIAFRSILRGLDGWNRDESRRRGKWRFVAFSASSGQSGDSMLHKFRLANNLNGKKYDSLFIYKSELLGNSLGLGDNVVFVDDFAGTGRQACEAWAEIEELLPGNPTVYLILVAASVSARTKITNETHLTVIPHIELTNCDNIFSSECGHFTTREKDALLRYCQKGDKHNPRGYGNCGLVIVFAHNCPNNSIPILHAHHHKWEGLFRRYD